MKSKTSTLMAFLSEKKPRKLVEIKGRQIQLLVQVEREWGGHQLRRAGFHLSIPLEMRIELMYVCVKKRFVLCVDLDLKRF